MHNDKLSCRAESESLTLSCMKHSPIQIAPTRSTAAPCYAHFLYSIFTEFLNFCIQFLVYPIITLLEKTIHQRLSIRLQISPNIIISSNPVARMYSSVSIGIVNIIHCVATYMTTRKNQMSKENARPLRNHDSPGRFLYRSRNTPAIANPYARSIMMPGTMLIDFFNIGS